MNKEEFKIHALLKQEADFLIDRTEELKPWLENIFASAQNQQRNRTGNQRERIENSLEKAAFGQSQIRQLVHAAGQASGLKELSLFIRYQMGRDDKRQSWNRQVHNKTLGDAVIEQLNKIAERTKSLISEADSPEFQRQLFLMMAERFFHYWTWQYRYLLSQAQNQAGRAAR